MEVITEENPSLSANRLAAAGFATPLQEKRNASSDISIDNSQSPTAVVLSLQVSCLPAVMNRLD